MSELTIRRSAATCQCQFATVGPHHDQLLAAPSDVAMAVELFEVAVTWQELDYSGEAVISPVDWLEFAAQHSWDDPRLARRLFRAARDIALRHPADTRPSVVTTPFLTSKEETQ